LVVVVCVLRDMVMIVMFVVGVCVGVGGKWGGSVLHLVFFCFQILET